MVDYRKILFRGLPFEIQGGGPGFYSELNFFFQIARAQLLFFQIAGAQLFFFQFARAHFFFKCHSPTIFFRKHQTDDYQDDFYYGNKKLNEMTPGTFRRQERFFNE